MDKAYLDLALSEMKWLLSIPSPSGFTMEISKKLAAHLKEMGFEPRQSLKGAVTALLGGEGRPLVLAAHVDTLGAMVRAIKPNGRLKVAHVGGLNLNAVEGENCLVHTRGGQCYTGVFQTIHPSTHVYADARALERSEENMEVVLDEDVHTQEETRALSVCAGDFVSFDPRTVFTPSGYIKSRHLDDKAGAGILLALARMVKDGVLALNRKVYILFTTYEEVGHGAASALPEDAQEVISVDMGCVGEDLTGDETMACICAGDSRGPSDYQVTGALMDTARRLNLRYAVDVYRSYVSDADVALTSGHEVRHGAVGPGVFASHAYERTHISGIENTLALLEGYVS